MKHFPEHGVILGMRNDLQTIATSRDGFASAGVFTCPVPFNNGSNAWERCQLLMGTVLRNIGFTGA
jgi:hypothetical protein